MKKKKLILFDFDGTLLDSDQMIVVTFQQLYDLYKKDNIFDLKKVLTFSGPPIKETLKNEFPDIDQDFIFNEFVRLSTINYDKYVHLFPYVKEMIDTLKRNNIKVGLITSKARKATMYALSLCALDNVFDIVVCADDVKKTKPNPEGIYKALKAFNIAKDDTLYVGDTNYDYFTSENANIDFAYVSFSPRKLIQDAKNVILIHDFESFTKEIINA